VDIVTITVAGLVLLALLYHDWLPQLRQWVSDRVRS
jgi:hypothetical protein